MASKGRNIIMRISCKWNMGQLIKAISYRCYGQHMACVSGDQPQFKSWATKSYFIQKFYQGQLEVTVF